VAPEVCATIADELEEALKLPTEVKLERAFAAVLKLESWEPIVDRSDTALLSAVCCVCMAVSGADSAATKPLMIDAVSSPEAKPLSWMGAVVELEVEDVAAVMTRPPGS
jgi:hypothetical protein